MSRSSIIEKCAANSRPTSRSCSSGRGFSWPTRLISSRSAERLETLRAVAAEEGIDYAEVSAADDRGLEVVVDWIRGQSADDAGVS